MGKRVACVFSTIPYGSVISQEGLDVSLALSMSFDTVGMFFIADGVFLILSNQKSEKITNKQVLSFSFEILSFCGIQDIYLCADSAFDRGITNKEVSAVSLNVIWLSSHDWCEQLSLYNLVLNF